MGFLETLIIPLKQMKTPSRQAPAAAAAAVRLQERLSAKQKQRVRSESGSKQLSGARRPGEHRGTGDLKEGGRGGTDFAPSHTARRTPQPEDESRRLQPLRQKGPGGLPGECTKPALTRVTPTPTFTAPSTPAYPNQPWRKPSPAAPPPSPRSSGARGSSCKPNGKQPPRLAVTCDVVHCGVLNSLCLAAL
ncbi:hypothetical protein SKAU_G00112640 [Synaphobranchus kaupii]|uniref:Uncharacterized protein n=1 Tax=Synaphobranchus kaupii TaxID=118154 RepID=A0A9Q1J8H1_SYNKA|nr:hypothetical protein SKAU_G00112640 [Synaphobranchus kaupii]